MYKVSVVIPVYNVEKYLKKCIDSVLGQSYKNFEIILVDDESTDNSGKICDEYSSKYQFIKTIHKKNGGLGLARNTGMNVAQGEYITFVDSDDIVEKNMIESLMKPIIEQGADTVIGGFKRIDTENNILSEEKYANEMVIGSDIYNKTFIKMLGSSPRGQDSLKMSVWNVMYSKKIILENHLLFVSERKLVSEDIVWNFSYFKFSQKLCVIASTEYRYRKTPGSLTKKYDYDYFNKIKVLYNYLEKKVFEEDLGEEALIRLQKQFFINLRSSILNEKVSGKSRNNVIKGISAITRDELVLRIISEYPIRKMGIKQQIFLRLIKMHANRILYMLN